MEERVIRVIMATGNAPTDTTGRIQFLQVSNPETGSQPICTENRSINISASQKLGMAASTTANVVAT